jgi:hypothetical protein
MGGEVPAYRDLPNPALFELMREEFDRREWGEAGEFIVGQPKPAHPEPPRLVIEPPPWRAERNAPAWPTAPARLRLPLPPPPWSPYFDGPESERIVVARAAESPKPLLPPAIPPPPWDWARGSEPDPPSRVAKPDYPAKAQPRSKTPLLDKARAILAEKAEAVNTITVHGQILDRLGLARQVYPVADPKRGFDVRRRFWQTRPEELRHVQPPSQLNIEHGEVIGQVLALERAPDGVWATAICNETALLRDRRPWFFSAETDSNVDGSDVVIKGVALTRHPAQTMLEAVRVYAGDPRLPEDRRRWRLREPFASRLERAGVSMRHKSSSTPIVVRDETTPEITPLGQGRFLVDGELRVAPRHRPPGQLEHRPCQILFVR